MGQTGFQPALVVFIHGCGCGYWAQGLSPPPPGVTHVEGDVTHVGRASSGNMLVDAEALALLDVSPAPSYSHTSLAAPAAVIDFADEAAFGEISQRGEASQGNSAHTRSPGGAP